MVLGSPVVRLHAFSALQVTVLREQFLTYTLEDIMEIDCRQTLEKLCNWYNPLSQPWTWAEALYPKVMSDLIRENY